MKKLLPILFLLFSTSVFAADTEVQDLTDITSPAVGDDMYIVDDPDGTPISRKINVGNLLAVAADLDTSGQVADDSHNHVTTNIDSATSATWASQISDEDSSGLCTAGVFCMGGHEHAGANLTDDVFIGNTGDTITGHLTIDNFYTLRLEESTGSGNNYLAFQAPTAVTSNATCTFENDSHFIPDSCVGDGSDDDVPDAGDFGSATDLDSNGALNTNSVQDNEIDYSAVTCTDLTMTDCGDITVGASNALTVPQGAAPTVNADGEIAQDTTDDQLLYGADPHVIDPVKTECFTLESPVEGDDNVPVFIAPEAITIVETACHIDAGTITSFTFQDSTDTTVDAPTCTTSDTFTWDAAMSGTATLTKGEVLEFDISTPSGITWLNGCFRYTTDRL